MIPVGLSSANLLMGNVGRRQKPDRPRPFYAPIALRSGLQSTYFVAAFGLLLQCARRCGLVGALPELRHI